MSNARCDTTVNPAMLSFLNCIWFCRTTDVIVDAPSRGSTLSMTKNANVVKDSVAKSVSEPKTSNPFRLPPSFTQGTRVKSTSMKSLYNPNLDRQADTKPVIQSGSGKTRQIMKQFLDQVRLQSFWMLECLLCFFMLVSRPTTSLQWRRSDAPLKATRTPSLN